MKLNGSLIGKLTLICKIFMRYMCFVSKNKISEMKLGYSCCYSEDHRKEALQNK